MIKSIRQETRKKMDKSIRALKNELNRVRTGRASLTLIDGINIDYYGASTPINQLATISIPESRLLTIQPWDVSIIKDIEKAILKSDLNLTPANDGKVLRLSIPPLTEKRRKELVKIAGKICEEHKVAIRNVRRKSNELIKELKKDGDISEDEAFTAQEDIQKITDKYIKVADEEIYKPKEKEILEI